VTILLSLRTHLHHLVRAALSVEEVTDGLMFAAAVLVVRPLTPDRYLGPYGAINPRIIWKIVILLVSISAARYIAVRLLGPRFGLPITGLASGFVSSTATPAFMASRLTLEPALARPAIAGAVRSAVTTIVQMAIVIGATSQSTLHLLRVPLLSAGTAALAYGLGLTFFCVRHEAISSNRPGRPFDLKTTLVLAATMTAILNRIRIGKRVVRRDGPCRSDRPGWFRRPAFGGISFTSLVESNKLGVRESAAPILAVLRANTVTKIVIAISGGGRRFGSIVVPGLLLVCVAACVPVLFFG
jgi:uncharacterized membrane protein (DUF4010 family)